MSMMDLKTLITQSPYHRWLGVELLEQEPGMVKVRLPYRAEFAGNDEATNIHGGVISALADITVCFAMMSQTGHDAPNVNLSVEYLRMVQTGMTLIATGRVVKAGRTLGVADVEIHTDGGKLIAVGRSTLINTAPNREQLTGKTTQ